MTVESIELQVEKVFYFIIIVAAMVAIKLKLQRSNVLKRIRRFVAVQLFASFVFVLLWSTVRILQCASCMCSTFRHFMHMQVGHIMHLSRVGRVVVKLRLVTMRTRM